VVNAGRHAEATRVEISLRRVANQIELRVADDGQGFSGMNGMDRINGVSSEPGHLGLASMRERAELLDGELTIESSDRGTRVMVLAPLKPVAA
jgi:signal transduction histidine kinase